MSIKDMEVMCAALNASGIERALVEQIVYAVDYERTVTALEARLRGGYQFEEIITAALATALEFYDADSAVVVSLDMELMIAQPEFEIHRDGVMPVCGTMPMFLNEYPEILQIIRQVTERGASLPYTEIITLLAKGTRDLRRAEQLGIRSMMAAPYCKRSTGFVAVVNPRRYLGQEAHNSLLQVISYVAVAEMNEMELMNRRKSTIFDKGRLAPNEVYVRLLNGFELHTKEGVVREADIRSNQGVLFLAHLLTKKGTPVSEEALLEILWDKPEELSAPERVLKNLGYSVKKRIVHLFPANGFLEISRSAYSVGRKYHIVTDLDLFGYRVRDIQGIPDVETRLAKYRELLDDFTGVVLPGQDHRSLRALDDLYEDERENVQLEYIALLCETGKYRTAHEYISRTMLTRKKGAAFAWWDIQALNGMGRPEQARILFCRNEKLFSAAQREELEAKLGGM